jgi:hypothetical protein
MKLEFSEFYYNLVTDFQFWLNRTSVTESLREIVGFEVLTPVVMRGTIFWDITPSCMAYSSTLNMEAICSSETSVDVQRTTRCYIREDNNLYFR